MQYVPSAWRVSQHPFLEWNGSRRRRSPNLAHDGSVRKTSQKGVDGILLEYMCKARKYLILAKWEYYQRDCRGGSNFVLKGETRMGNPGRFRGIVTLKKLSLAISDQSFSGVVDGVSLTIAGTAECPEYPERFSDADQRHSRMEGTDSDKLFQSQPIILFLQQGSSESPNE